MLPGFEYGFPDKEQTVWCIQREGDTSGWMLCGRKVGFVPVLQPTDPAAKCRDCLQAMYGPVPAAPRAVVCPACQQGVRVVDGRVAAHPDVAGMACTGVNLPVGRRR